MSLVKLALNYFFIISIIVIPNWVFAGSPAELMHWQKMIGRWQTTEHSLKPDGSAWQASGKADWNFYWAMGGWAVRDEYFSPPLAMAVDNDNARQIGTNLRVFNRDKNQWLMAWITKAGKSVDLYTAESDENRIVMLSKSKTPQGKFARITFLNMTDNSFDWTLEWSNDGQSGWLEVHRIHGKRVD